MKKIFKTLLVVVVFVNASALAQNYVWRTLAGAMPGGADGAGDQAQFYYPSGISTDADGNLIVADELNHTVRKVSPSGVVTTLAGKAGSEGGVNGFGATVRFNRPSGVAVDRSGNIYVCDRINHCIRKIAPTGEVTTFAGVLGAAGSADGSASQARFSQPKGIAVDANDIIYVADTNNHTIRKILPDGTVSTLAGMAKTTGSNDGQGSLARFNFPASLSVSTGGEIFVADSSNHTIRKITPSGQVSTLAGLPGQSGNVNGNGSSARFNIPNGICWSQSGDIYVTDYNNQSIRKITSTGEVTTLTGSVQGKVDGALATALFWGPGGVTAKSNGELFICDSVNWTIRKLSTDGNVSTLAGKAPWGDDDGLAKSARFYFGQYGAISVAPSGKLYIADTFNFVIREIDLQSVLATYAGQKGQPATLDGPTTSAKFSYVSGIACDSQGNVYVSQVNSNNIRKISVNGQVTTLAGALNTPGSVDGTGITARFRSPFGLAVDALDRVIIADRDNHAIRRMTSDGVVSTIAGTIGTSGTTNGPALNAGFNGPQSAAVDTNGVIYVADTNNHCIRKITADGNVETFAGVAGTSGYVDGSATVARFISPAGVATDTFGNVYVSEGGARIRKITPSGQTSTIGGTNTLGYSEGIGNAALFNGPRRIAVDSQGMIYVPDSANHRIVVGGVMPFQEILSPEQTLMEGAEGVISFGQSILGRTSTKEITLKNRGTAALDVQCAFSGINASEFILAGGLSTVSVPAGSELKLTIQHTPLGQQGERAASLRLTSNDVIQPDLMIALGSTAIDAKPFFSISPVNAVTKNPGQSMTFAALYISGLDPFTYRWRRNGTTISGATGSSYTISSAQQIHEGSYDCVITNSYGSFTTPASVLFVNDPVVILTPPLSQAANVGQEVTLNVTATGTEPMEFQWRKNGTPLPEENAPGLVMVVDADSGGFYDVMITNPLGSVTSATAALTVLIPPVISVQPANQNVSVGSTAFFSVTASGPGLTYQWRRNGVDLSKQTGAMLMISNVQKANEGVYDVVVKNIFGVVLSDPARLNLPQPLSITEHPQDVTASPGDTASFAVAATGQGTLSYQWHKDGKAIKDAKSSTLNVPVVDPTAAGAYTVTVASGSLKVTSAPAYLRVPEAGLLIYKFTVTGNSYEGTSSSKIALSGLLVLDRLNQRGGIIRFGKNGKLATFVTLVDDGLRTDSTGPVTNSQTVVSKVVKAEDSPEQETTTLWLRGTDGPVTFSSADKTMAPKTLSGFQTELGLADYTQVTSLSLAATLDNAASLLARQAGETVEQTLNRLAAGLQQKGFIRE